MRLSVATREPERVRVEPYFRSRNVTKPSRARLVRSPSRAELGSKILPNNGIKTVASLVTFAFLRFFLISKVSFLTCDITLSIIHILEEQSSEGDFSLFFSTQTWF
jgi:hypothetical protein